MNGNVDEYAKYSNVDAGHQSHESIFSFQAASRLVIAACCYARSSAVSRFVCLLVTFVSPAKMAEPIEMPYGVVTWVSPIGTMY